MTTTDADRSVIALLRENARMPVSEIARRLGVSRSTAQSRLERLERIGAGKSLHRSKRGREGRAAAHRLIERGRCRDPFQPRVGRGSLWR